MKEAREAPGPDHTRDRRIALTLFTLAALSATWFFSGGGWNQNSQFALTRAMVEKRSFAIDRWSASTGDVARGDDGRLYSNKAPGVSFAAAVPYAAARAVAGGATDSYRFVQGSAWLATVLVAGVSGALIPVMVFLYARRRLQVEARWAMLVAFATFFGTNVFGFSTMLFSHVPSAALHFAAFALVAAGSPWLIAAGVCAGFAAASNYLLVPFVGGLALLLLRNRRSWPAVGRFLAGAAVPLAAVAFYHWVAFGSPLRTAMSSMNPAFISRQAWLLGIVERPKLSALAGITISPYRGLLYLSPFLVLALLGVFRMWRNAPLRLDAAYASLVTIFLLAFNASFNGWEGGFSIGPRYLIPAIPFIVLFLLSVQLKPIVRMLFLFLATIACIHNFAATAVDPQPSGSIAAPLEQYIYPLLFRGEYPEETLRYRQWQPELYRGHASVNRETMLEAAPFEYFRPGSRESEWASFNVGELVFGAGSPWSVLPIALIILGGFSLLMRMTRDAEVDAAG